MSSSIHGVMTLQPLAVIDSVLSTIASLTYKGYPIAGLGDTKVTISDPQRVPIERYNLARICVEKNPLLDNQEFRDDFHSIVDLLIEDGHIAIDSVNRITLTFKGKMFQARGGYEATSKSLDEAKSQIAARELRAENTALRLNTLTGWLAVGTMALVLVELIKFLIEGSSHTLATVTFLTSAVIFLFGIIAGIIIYMLISEGLNRRNK